MKLEKKKWEFCIWENESKSGLACIIVWVTCVRIIGEGLLKQFLRFCQQLKNKKEKERKKERKKEKDT